MLLCVSMDAQREFPDLVIDFYQKLRSYPVASKSASCMAFILVGVQSLARTIPGRFGTIADIVQAWFQSGGPFLEESSPRCIER